jgi:hypothetical protein
MNKPANENQKLTWVTIPAGTSQIARAGDWEVREAKTKTGTSAYALTNGDLYGHVTKNREHALSKLQRLAEQAQAQP